MTFSIVAWDQGSRPHPEWGVAVASKFLAVGAIVPWTRAGVGALATQAHANLAYGPDGLDHLARGESAPEVVGLLTASDDDHEHRQLGVVDAVGRAATFTGRECQEWAGGHAGEGYCCQGNILTGPEVVDEMARAFESSAGPLSDRLLAALRAGEEAGGDRRGKQSAALLVVRREGAYGGRGDRAVDLRVDDHVQPVTELGRILELHRDHFARAGELEFVDIDDALAEQLRALLSGLGYKPGAGPGPYDQQLRAALFAFVGTENLEERWSEEARIERRVLAYLRGRRTR